MDLSHIHFHDCGIRRVIELPAEDELWMEVAYPVNWHQEVYELRILAFTDVLDYAVKEGPFAGAPTILDVTELERDERRVLLRIDTNAGFRLLRCASVQLRIRYEIGLLSGRAAANSAYLRTVTLCALAGRTDQ